jgi:hypothetical protein
VLLLLFMACAARKDVDLDGLVGSRDDCPRQAETINGYADDDGCPDELARLRVIVVDAAGRGVEGAAVSLPGAPPVRTDASGVAMFFELLPVPELMVEARHGSAGRGQAALPLPDGPAEVTITLAQQTDSP